MPSSCQSDKCWIGALFANSNLFSMTLCISAFMALALSILITFSHSLRCTRFVAPVRGSPLALFILRHSSRCSLHFDLDTFCEVFEVQCKLIPIV
jgi:hypothetical protein